MRFGRSLAVACVAGLFLTLAAAPAGAGKQNPIQNKRLTIGAGMDVVDDAMGSYPATLNAGGSLEMRLPAERGFTVSLGSSGTLKCQPDPYWSKIWILNAYNSKTDARIDCAVTGSGGPTGTATPWLLDFPPYKYPVTGDDLTPCIDVASNTVSSNECEAKVYAGGFRRSGPNYQVPVSFSISWQ